MLSGIIHVYLVSYLVVVTVFETQHSLKATNSLLTPTVQGKERNAFSLELLLF